ncbi:hypothetical protein C7E23_14140 [Elizabethkingia anophelis]|nr:hypothetical protein C7E23_14140 [Elizabethkingia anophelis]
MGIADYMKVEQTLHAYVPGEVSNIENVMASELRHKKFIQAIENRRYGYYSYLHRSRAYFRYNYNKPK